MRVRLKGIATATKKLADGQQVTYYYAWRGGPRLDGEPGSARFMTSYNEAVRSRRTADPERLASLVATFRSSDAYQSLGEKSKRAYNAYLKDIEARFGTMPIAALAEPPVKNVFFNWRDGMASTPRKADYAWTTLARVLSVAKKRGLISINPCEAGGRLYESDRLEKIWGEAEIADLLAVAPSHMVLAILLALWTGQREGDLLRLPWSAYDGRYITLRQSKSSRRGRPRRKVTIPVGKTLKAALDAAPRRGPFILTTSRKVATPWTEFGFRSSWKKLVARAGLADADLHFHDFRGTAITRLAIAGASLPEIATITGHSLKTVQEIVDRFYLDRDIVLAENAIAKLERRYK